MVSQPDIQLQQEQADVLGDMLAKADIAAAYRDPSIPEGSILGETDLPGQQVRWRKQKSMVRSGTTPLPERFEAFDRDGVVSMLPTAQMGRMLSKPRADDTSVRAFHTHSRGMTRETCQTCPPTKAAIEGTCNFCFERTHGAVVKRFTSEGELYTHKEMFHERELRSLERVTDQAQRQAEIDTQRQLAEAMMAMARANADSAPHVEAAQAAVTPQKRA
jgi:hypothetical protein